MRESELRTIAGQLEQLEDHVSTQTKPENTLLERLEIVERESTEYAINCVVAKCRQWTPTSLGSKL